MSPVKEQRETAKTTTRPEQKSAEGEASVIFQSDSSRAVLTPIDPQIEVTVERPEAVYDVITTNILSVAEHDSRSGDVLEHNTQSIKENAQTFESKSNSRHVAVTTTEQTIDKLPSKDNTKNFSNKTFENSADNLNFSQYKNDPLTYDVPNASSPKETSILQGE